MPMKKTCPYCDAGWPVKRFDFSDGRGSKRIHARGSMTFGDYETRFCARNGWFSRHRLATAAIVFCIVCAALALFSKARANERHHPPQDQAIHERFYSTWFMPDAPNVSCCHNQDCSPAASKYENGHWSARRNDDEDWIDIPASKIEQNRDSPDGRSHLCGRGSLSAFTVFCFVRGGGA